MVRIISSGTIMSGDWTIEGTRVLAVTIAEYLHSGRSDAEIFDDFPTLPAGAIDAVRIWMTGIYRNLDRDLVRNSAHCLLCHDDIESISRHDFKWCRCHNVAVDGGSGRGSYARRAYMNSSDPGVTWVNTSIFAGNQP